MGEENQDWKAKSKEGMLFTSSVNAQAPFLMENLDNGLKHQKASFKEKERN